MTTEAEKQKHIAEALAREYGGRVLDYSEQVEMEALRILLEATHDGYLHFHRASPSDGKESSL
jgi:nitrous oxide reductase accessory protein NosL